VQKIVTSEVLQPIQQYSKPFKNIEDLRDLIKAASKAKYVLLGEATHG